MLCVEVPASTSNFGSGFDAFGLALSLCNEFYVDFAPRYEVTVEGEGQNLPKDESNLFVRAYRRTCQLLGLEERPMYLRQVNRVPTARGLGSSSTAIVGGITACEALYGLELELEQKLKIAMEFEPHPDNLLPAFVGGFVVCASSEEGVSFLRLSFPEELKLVLCVPDFELLTERAREVVKKEVPLKEAVYNLQRSALLVGALLLRRFDLLSEAVKDKLHQPYRAELVPGLRRVISGAYEAGAKAVFLSGAGPSVASLCTEGEEEVGKAMVEAFAEVGVSARYLLLSAREEGVLIKNEGADP
ncbi:MAG: homoserine kinase [Aquificaceae bacterium]|nr:homoserine kinase [Aquificaceae bacterium]MDW8097744.1 homoserine kinase [Aquificaceae bacterium]